MMTTTILNNQILLKGSVDQERCVEWCEGGGGVQARGEDAGVGPGGGDPAAQPVPRGHTCHGVIMVMVMLLDVDDVRHVTRIKRCVV